MLRVCSVLYSDAELKLYFLTSKLLRKEGLPCTLEAHYWPGSWLPLQSLQDGTPPRGRVRVPVESDAPDF